jgi:hypothetical protein
LGDKEVNFTYSYVDAAMAKDPSPALYRLIWLNPLPAEGLTAQASLSGNVSEVKWSTLSEQNTSHFVVERSTDNKNFTATGNTVKAAGSSAEKREYSLQDDVASLVHNNNAIYYRVKLVDIDGKEKYSNVVVIRIVQNMQINAWPNPFHSAITISVTSTKATTFHIRLMDISGKLVRQTSHPVSSGISQITLNDFDKLSAGIYLIEMTDEKTGTKTIQRLLKN